MEAFWSELAVARNRIGFLEDQLASCRRRLKAERHGRNALHLLDKLPRAREGRPPKQVSQLAEIVRTLVRELQAFHLENDAEFLCEAEADGLPRALIDEATRLVIVEIEGKSVAIARQAISNLGVSNGG